jgi:hypothetical protein
MPQVMEIRIMYIMTNLELTWRATKHCRATADASDDPGSPTIRQQLEDGDE